jgi:hypothetical protein
MLKVFYNNLINRTVCLLLVAIFMSTYTTGATALAFCLDEDENHLVGQNQYLVNCHTSVKGGQLLSNEHCSTQAEKENKDCTDISLTSANKLNRPSKITPAAVAKIKVFYTLPSNPIVFQHKAAGHIPAVTFQQLSTSSHLNAHRTIVLLI